MWKIHKGDHNRQTQTVCCQCCEVYLPERHTRAVLFFSFTTSIKLFLPLHWNKSFDCWCSTWAVMPAEPDTRERRLMKASGSSLLGKERIHTVLLAQKGNKCDGKTIIPQSFPTLHGSHGPEQRGDEGYGAVWPPTGMFNMLSLKTYTINIYLQIEISCDIVIFLCFESHHIWKEKCLDAESKMSWKKLWKQCL